MRWPWRPRETRGSAPYRDTILSGLLARHGDPVSSASGAIQSAALMWARCLSVAKVDHPAVGPDTLSAIGYDLATIGESVWIVDVDAGGIRLIRGSSWALAGGADRRAWTYDITISGPSRFETRKAPAAAVLHCMHVPDTFQPWRGTAPWMRAPVLAGLAAGVEAALRAEMKQPVVAIIPQPQGASIDRGTLRSDIQSRDHSILLPPTTTAGYGAGRGSAPLTDWKPIRLKPDPSEAVVQLCRDVPVSVAGLFGIPPVLVSGSGSETQTREAFRRFVAATVQPLALSIGAALSDVLGVDLALDLADLRGFDSQGQARTFGTLRKAGVELDEALRLAGLLDE